MPCTNIVADTGWDSRFEGSLRCFLPFLSASRSLTGSATLRDLGLDSMGAVELLAALENVYDVRFREDTLTMDTFATPGTLWAALRRTVS
ncbi:MAG: acyl carrier protein [Kibdelosporangium sp.]